ncbi:hypothetical protein Q7P37_010925 [Cladosporium fusiforme]
MRGIPCRYAGPEDSRSQATPGGMVPICLMPGPSRSLSGTAPPQEDLIELAGRAPDALLWQYYLAHASRTIAVSSIDPSHTRMWVNSIPAIAFKHPIASHAMLAFSAFCMSASPRMKSTTYDLRATACLHYCQSVNSLRKSLPIMDASTLDAVLACAMIMIPCGITLAQSHHGVFALHDWVHHLRGWVALGSLFCQLDLTVDNTTRLIPYPQLGIPGPGDLPTPRRGHPSLMTSTDPFISAIRRTWRKAMADLIAATRALHIDHESADLDACLVAINSLEYVIDYILNYPIPNLFRAVFQWVLYIPRRFIELLTAHDDLSLAIYAHWLVLAMTLEDLWWTRDFGSGQLKRLVESDMVSSKLSLGMLKWPVEMREEWLKNGSSCHFVQSFPT